MPGIKIKPYTHESTNLASGDLPRPEKQRAKILRNKVKRLLIKSHYLFVANAAAWSCISGGLLGLNGSQANKSQSLLLYLPAYAEDLANGGLRYLLLVLALRPDVLKRRVFHAATRHSCTTRPQGDTILSAGIELKRSPI